MVRKVQAKTILSKLKQAPDSYFGITYNMNLYRGCQHACVYCDSRSDVYQLGNLADIRIKENAIELLHSELKAKRTKATIGTGSMNDPYMPVEADLRMTRNALQVIHQHRFPVHVMTKSDLVARDVDVLQAISQVYAAVSFTITTPYDNLSKQIEPGAVPSSKRFKAMARLAKEGIYTGVILTPVLPYLTDNPDAIKELVHKASDHGAQYILCWTGMTLRQGQREYYYRELDACFPGVRSKYEQKYARTYSCAVPNAKALWEVLEQACECRELAQKMLFYRSNEVQQLGLFE